MDIQKLYLQTLEGLKGHHRPKHNFTHEQFLFLFQTLEKALEEKDWELMEKIFCLLGHAKRPHEIFEELICKILNHTQVPLSLKIFTLNASGKYIIQRRNQLAQKLPTFYLEAIRSLLSTNKPELKEWALRTIDEMGNQGKPLISDILKNRPRFLSMLNKHNRYCHDIIESLVKKWGLHGRIRKKS